MSKPDPEARCPICHGCADAATSALNGRKEPEPGDWTVCGWCGSILRFTSGMTVRIALPHEAREIPVGLQLALLKISKAIRFLRSIRN